MALLNAYSIKSLIAAYCFIFSIFLLLSAFALMLVFTYTVIIILILLVVIKAALLSTNIIISICSLLLLLLEHLLDIVRLKTLITLNYYLSLLILSALLF
jgi:hypothetical protein